MLDTYDSHFILQNCFFSFSLPVLEYCAPVWRSAAETHLKLLDRSFNMVKFLLPEIRVDFFLVVVLLVLYHFFKKIVNNVQHPFHSIIPIPDIHQCTRQTVYQNDHCFVVGRCSTEQFSRIFVPYSVRV